MKTLPFLFTAITCFAGVLQADDFVPPLGEHAAVLYGFGMPPEVQAIEAKMKEALAKNRTWLQEYVASANVKPGKILPYHPNFGITEEEYATMVAAMPQAGLFKIGAVKVKVRKEDNGRVIEIQGANVPVSKFEELPSGQWRCDLGTTTLRKPIHQKDPNSPTGEWQGEQWELSEGDPNVAGTAEVKHLRFAVGKDVNGGSLIYVRVISNIEGKITDFTGVIRWSPTL